MKLANRATVRVTSGSIIGIAAFAKRTSQYRIFDEYLRLLGLTDDHLDVVNSDYESDRVQRALVTGQLMATSAETVSVRPSSSSGNKNDFSNGTTR